MESTKLYEEDAFRFLRRQKAASVDLIVTDPPYESLEKHRKKATTTRLKVSKASSNVWFSTVSNERLDELMLLLFKVLKRDSHCYVFCDSETLFLLKPAGEKVGFKFWKPIIWDKLKIGMGYHYRSRYEFIIFFEKGKRKLNIFFYSGYFGSFSSLSRIPLSKTVISYKNFCGSK